MTHTRANKSKILALILGLTMCLALMLGIAMASPTNTVYAAGEDGTAPTIIRTGGNDVDRANLMSSLPAAIKGKEYKAADGSNYKIEATGTAPFTFSIPLSYLPKGLSLNETTGEIVGTPTEAGSFTVTIYVENAYGSDNVLVSLRVYDDESKPKITTTQADIAVGYIGSFYSQNIDYDEGTGYPPEASISGNLPTGLSLRKSGYAFYIEGTPSVSVAETFTFTVRLQNAAGFDEKTYTITIQEGYQKPKIINIDDIRNEPAIKGKYFEFQFVATGTNTADNPFLFFTYLTQFEESTPNAQDEYELGNGLFLTKEGKVYGTPVSTGKIGFYVGAKTKNLYDSYEESGFGAGSCYFLVYENGQITFVTISPENTSVPKGGQRQFTATVTGYGDFDKSVTWDVFRKSSEDTKISQDGVLTVGIDETATTIGVQATSKGNINKFLEIPVSIIDHMHSISLVPATPKTCTTDGNIEHFKCNVCGDLFADAGGVNSLTGEQVKIPAGHEYGDLVPKQEPTCTQTGMQAYYKCSVCNKYFDESKTEKTVAKLTISIDPNAHDFGAWIAEVPATCVATGTKGHKDCNRCNRHYDESGNEITDLTIPTNDNHDWNAWVSNGDGTHTRTCKRDGSHTENANCSGGTATCTTKAVCEVCKTTYGNTAPHNTTQYGGKDSSGHWDKCSTCDNKFNFEAHTPDREKADETNPVKCTKCGFEITPAGHYEHTADSEWHNSADGTYHYHKCTHSGCSVTLDKADHSGGTKTCENKAVCSVCGVAYGDKLGHDYGEVKYIWTDNVCKAERVCKHDSNHIESETVTATGTTITEATCKEKGKMKYTATFVNTAFAMQEKEVDIDFAEHTYGGLIPEVPATTTEFGVKEHKDCTVCGRHFDKDGNEITELKIAKIGTHNVVINGESKFYAHGESVTVTAEDKEGKEFVGWQDESGEIVSTKKEYTFKVEGEKTLTAVYDDMSSGGEITPPAKKDGLSGGQIAGIVIGSVLLAGIGGFAIFWFAVKKKTFADLGVALKKGFTAMGNFFKTLGAKIKALFTKKK